MSKSSIVSTNHNKNKNIVKPRLLLEKKKILHLYSIKGNHINLVNSFKFFWSELREMKRFLYRVETGNAGMVL